MVARKDLRKELKTKYIETLIALLEQEQEEVLRVKDHEIAIPVVDSEGNEDFIRITVAIPTGSRTKEGIEPYDGYEMAEDYQLRKKNDEEKAKAAAEEKAKKIERDKKYREKQAEKRKKREE